ncbi:MAG: PKD domain-containing protein, partial [Blastocatellia bacterium]
SDEPLIDRVQLQAGASLSAVQNFEILVSETSDPSSFTSVLHGTYQNNATLQEFVFPSGTVRARFVKLIVDSNYGGTSVALSTFNAVSLSSVDNIISLPGQNDLAKDQSPSLIANGASVVAFSNVNGDGTSPNLMLSFNNSSGWSTGTGAGEQFAVISLAGGTSYLVDGIRLSPLGGVKDFEVWVSNTTTDSTAFTRVLSATAAAAPVLQTFLFPGGPVQARYVKYIPLNDPGAGTESITAFFDVIAEGVAGVVDYSSFQSILTIPDRAFDHDSTTFWSTAAGQVTDQFVKVQLAGGTAHKIYGVRIEPSVPNGPKDFDIRVSTTTSDDAAFTTVFSGTAANTTSVQEFDFPSAVDARYVEFFFKTGYGITLISVNNLQVLAAPDSGSALFSFSSQALSTQTAASALDIDTTNGPWVSAAGQNQNQSLTLILPGPGPWTVDQVALQPGNPNGANATVGAKDFDLMVSTTDTADASFTTVFSGTLQNIQAIQNFVFPAVQASYIKLVLKDNYGSASQIALNSFFAVSPQLGSTTARFIDRSSEAAGTIVSYAWNFGDGGISSNRDPVHSYAAPGSYTVSQTVINDAGQSSTTQLIYHAAAPIAPAFTVSPSVGHEGVQSSQFFDQSPSQLNGLTRLWDFGNNTGSSSANSSTSYADNGLYTVTLTVGNTAAIHFTASQKYEVDNLPPLAAISSPQNLLLPGQNWVANAIVSDPSPVDALTLRCDWDFGDGQTLETMDCTTSNSGVVHAFLAPGIFTVTLTVFDKDGGSATDSVQVQTTDKSPSAFTGFRADSVSQPGQLLLQATLIDGATKLPLPARNVTFAIAGLTANAITDQNGFATASITFTPGPTPTLASVFFAGDALYFSGGAGIQVQNQTAPSCVAQSRGTDFWLMFTTELAQGSTLLSLVISSDVATTGSVVI